jgi:hypothetical protein
MMIKRRGYMVGTVNDPCLKSIRNAAHLCALLALPPSLFSELDDPAKDANEDVSVDAPFVSLVNDDDRVFG